MAANTEDREEQRLKDEPFRTNAFVIIEEMWALTPQHPTVLMDEVIHSIFFLGKIKAIPYTPEELMDDDDMLKMLKYFYPEPFRQYATHLPRRSPMSCVLDIIVSQSGPEDEDTVKQKLYELIKQLTTDDEKGKLVSTAICVSRADKTNPDSKRYYGVSMSAPRSRLIMIGASCLSTYWDSYVAGAVMTYYPNYVPKGYFDGTFTLPQQVKCETFKISDGSRMDPCRSCGNLFGLTTKKTKEWPYGNCAECESVSNLLKNEQGVRENVLPVSDANRERARADLETELRNFLVEVHFFNNEQDILTFYVPQ